MQRACAKAECDMRSVSFSTRDRDTVMESCFSRHQTNLQQHNFTWELSEFGRAQTGFRLLCWRICGDSETLLQWQIWKPNQTYKALKLRQCILPFVDSIYILKVDVSIVKAHRLKPTGLLAEAVNVEMHVFLFSFRSLDRNVSIVLIQRVNQ